MGNNESTTELLVKVWEGIREFLEVPNESTGSLFRHMRVHIPKCTEKNLSGFGLIGNNLGRGFGSLAGISWLIQGLFGSR